VGPVARWGLHVAAYLVALVALLGLVDRDDGWNLDDGAYAIQVQVLRDGQDGDSWAYPYRHHDRDPASLFAPVSHSTTTSEGSFPLVKHPAWIEVLRASSSATDRLGDPTWGLYLPAVLAAVAAALLAGILADRLAPGLAGAGAVSFWVVALGPLVLHTHAMWAHGAAAAVGGAGALGLVALAQGRGRWWHLAVMAGSAAAMVSLRTEGLLYALALAATAGLAGRAVAHADAPGNRKRAAGSALWWSIPVVAAAAFARVANDRWVSSLVPGTEVDGPTDVGPQFSFAAGRVNGFVRTFVDGVGASDAGTFLALVVLVLAVLAGRASRRRPDRLVEALGMLGLAVLLVLIRSVVAPDDLGGLVVALPLLVAGLAAWDWRRATTGERALVGLVVLHALAVAAIQYPEGGSRDWGGRYLFPVLVPASVVATVTVWRLVVARTRHETGPTHATSRRRSDLGWAVVMLVAVAVPTAAGLVAASSTRASNRALTDLTLSVDVPTVVRVPRYLTRTSWRALPGNDWLSADVDGAADALAMLRPGRTEPVAVVGNGADQVRAPGYAREVRSPVVVIFTPTG
jgi:hypothetical protein